MKEDKRQFTASVRNKHFKIDKQTKRMLALMKFPRPPKLNVKEQAEADVSLETLTVGGFKDMMIRAQLAGTDAKLTGMNDPLWKPAKKKNEEGVADGTEDGAGTKSSARKPKGKVRAAVAETSVTTDESAS